MHFKLEPPSPSGYQPYGIDRSYIQARAGTIETFASTQNLWEEGWSWSMVRNP